MGKWLKKRIESLLDKLIFTAVLAGGAALWATVKSLPLLVIIGVFTGVFVVVLVTLRLLSLKIKQPGLQIKETYEDNVGECGLIFSNSGSTNLVNCKARLLDIAYETPSTELTLSRFPKVEDLICDNIVAGFSNGKIPLFRWRKDIVSKSLEIAYKKGTESIGYGVANVPILVLLNVWADNTQATYAVCKLESRLGWGYKLSILKTGLQRDKLELANFQQLASHKGGSQAE